MNKLPKASLTQVSLLTHERTEEKKKHGCSHWHDYMTLLTFLTMCYKRKNMHVGKELSGSQGNKILPALKTQTYPDAKQVTLSSFHPGIGEQEGSGEREKATLGWCLSEPRHISTFLSWVHQKPF